MPCHRENDVIYMEEARGHPTKAPLGVNATDMPGTGALFRFRPGCPMSGDGVGHQGAMNADGKSYSYGEVHPTGGQIFKYLSTL